MLKRENSWEVYIDYMKCVVVFLRIFGCLVCVKECMFIKGSYERIKWVYEKVVGR